MLLSKCREAFRKSGIIAPCQHASSPPLGLPVFCWIVSLPQWLGGLTIGVLASHIRQLTKNNLPFPLPWLNLDRFLPDFRPLAFLFLEHFCKFFLCSFEMSIFYNPEMSSSRTWEPSLWTVVTKKNSVPVSQSLWEDRILIPTHTNYQHRWPNHTDHPPPSVPSTFPLTQPSA